VSLNKIRTDLIRLQALAERDEVRSGVVVVEDLSEERLRLLRDAPAPGGNCRHGVLLVPRVCETSEEWEARALPCDQSRGVCSDS
jgi:hypothetical protein